ncbi:MAG: hypothetical protein PHG41_01535 [Actinomycetota bacterium]|nr:hypothetical protein [Actinomycetota bacterium]
MRVEKQKVRVRIKTESAIIKGVVHTLPDGRLSDYITSQKNRFIPVTDVEILYIDESGRIMNEGNTRREVVFINVEKIETIEYV